MNRIIKMIVLTLIFVSIYGKFLSAQTIEQQEGIMFNGNRYDLITSWVTWEEAEENCITRGGHLVTITSQNEYNFVLSLMGSENIWIGYTDDETEGFWRWVTGEVDSFTNWGQGEPNGGDYENFAEMYNNGLWNDATGDYNQFYVCEWESERGGDLYSNFIPNLLFAREIFMGGILLISIEFWYQRQKRKNKPD